nr:MAG TPA: hypothetical protein [Bacteriophage sp.]
MELHIQIIQTVLGYQSDLKQLHSKDLKDTHIHITNQSNQ